MDTATYRITVKKTKWLIQITENSRYGSDQRERVYDPELFGINEHLRKVEVMSLLRLQIMVVVLGLVLSGCAYRKGYFGMTVPPMAIANAKAELQKAKEQKVAVLAHREISLASKQLRDAEKLWRGNNGLTTGDDELDDRIREKSYQSLLNTRAALTTKYIAKAEKQLMEAKLNLAQYETLKIQLQAEKRQMEDLLARHEKLEAERRALDLKLEAERLAKEGAQKQMQELQQTQTLMFQRMEQLKALQDDLRRQKELAEKARQDAEMSALLEKQQAQQKMQEANRLKQQALITEKMAEKTKQEALQAAMFQEQQARKKMQEAKELKQLALLEKRSAEQTKREALENAQRQTQAAQQSMQEAEKIKQMAFLEKQAAQRLVAQAEEERQEMRQKLQTLTAEFARVREEKRGLVVTVSDILFDLNRATIKAGIAKNLEYLSKILQEYPDHQILVEGHTDNTGSAKYNMALSEKRAGAVMAHLMAYGIDGRRIDAKGYGKAKPVASNDVPEGRQRNRRVEIIILNEDQGGKGLSPISPLSPIEKQFPEARSSTIIPANVSLTYP